MTHTALSRQLTALALAGALGAFALFQVISVSSTGGVFEYPMDDPYIHMAMAEQIAAGGYGVNAGEYASAASSPLFPLLVMPFGLGEGQRYLPLAWNVVGLCLTAFLWARLLTEAVRNSPQYPGAIRVAALLGPIVLPMAQVAALGMEHSLHTAASLAVLLGLLRFSRDNAITPPLWLGAILGPMLRYEALALSLIAAAVLFFGGARRQSGVIAGLAVAPLVGFSLFLLSLGLDPLPSSVAAKMGNIVIEDPSRVSHLTAQMVVNLRMWPGLYLAVLSLVILVLVRFAPGLRGAGWASFAFALVAAGWAQIIFGQVGWANRYEHYILVCLSAGFLVILFQGGFTRNTVLTGTVVVLAVPAFLYGKSQLYLASYAASGIYRQQAQLARFAQAHLRAPVAVNDLGRVAWRNPDYVLDLWGLASAEARDIRLGDGDPAPGWAGPLAKRHDVQVAMIYDKWLGDAIGPEWQKLGDLYLTGGQGFLGSDRVAFYATAPEFVTSAQAAMVPFVSSLPAGTSFVETRAVE